MEDFVYAKMNNSASKIAEFCSQLADFIKKTVFSCVIQIIVVPLQSEMVR